MVVHVYFVSQVYRVFIRSLLTNFISLISNLGGVYSLLIGMSILSAFEVIYFFSIRLYANYREIKTEDMKPKTFSQRLDTVTISHLKVPRLDTAKSSKSSGSPRMSSLSHF
jgi:amiloride-sensitive sodium channel